MTVPPTPPPSPTPPRRKPVPIPLPVLGGALVAGLLAAAAVSFLMKPKPDPNAGNAAADSAAAADTAYDIAWQGVRRDGTDCVASFEITRGAVSGLFVASVMDSSGNIMRTDSTQVARAKKGSSVAIRFPNVNCAKIGDWQLQVLTPKKPPPRSP